MVELCGSFLGIAPSGLLLLAILLSFPAGASSRRAEVCIRVISLHRSAFHPDAISRGSQQPFFFLFSFLFSFLFLFLPTKTSTAAFRTRAAARHAARQQFSPDIFELKPGKAAYNMPNPSNGFSPDSGVAAGDPHGNFRFARSYGPTAALTRWEQSADLNGMNDMYPGLSAMWTKTSPYRSAFSVDPHAWFNNFIEVGGGHYHPRGRHPATSAYRRVRQSWAKQQQHQQQEQQGEELRTNSLYRGHRRDGGEPGLVAAAAAGARGRFRQV